MIARTGHKVAGKKCGAVLRGRCDSRVTKTNVHFPTDVGLCWDAVRCLIRVCASAAAAFEIPGWRKHADRTRKVYKAFQRVRTAPRYWRNRKGVKAYLQQCKKNATSARALLRALSDMEETAAVQARDRAVSALCGGVGGSNQASHTGGWGGGRRFRMRRRCFPFTSRIRGGSAKARRGWWLSWAFRSQLVEDQYQFILSHHIMWEGSDTEMWRYRS